MHLGSAHDQWCGMMHRRCSFPRRHRRRRWDRNIHQPREDHTLLCRHSAGQATIVSRSFFHRTSSDSQAADRYTNVREPSLTRLDPRAQRHDTVDVAIFTHPPTVS